MNSGSLELDFSFQLCVYIEGQADSSLQLLAVPWNISSDFSYLFEGADELYVCVRMPYMYFGSVEDLL